MMRGNNHEDNERLHRGQNDGASDVQEQTFDLEDFDNLMPISEAIATFEHGDANSHELLYKRFQINRSHHAADNVQGVHQNSRDAIANAFKRLLKAGKFASFDYSEPGCDIRKQWNFERPSGDYHRAEFFKWLLPVLVALCMALVALSASLGIKYVTQFKFSVTEKFLREGNVAMAFFFFVGFCAFLSFIAGFLVSMISPLAAGSGIPEMKVYLNGISMPGLLSVKTLIAKWIGVCFTISSGIIAGKEGPFIHVGGIVGSGIGQMGSNFIHQITGGRVSLRLPRGFGGYHRNHADHRDFVAIGTAIGVACAFSAPIGGILFTVEEGASFYTRSAFWRAFLATVVGVLFLEIGFLLAEGGEGEEEGSIFTAMLGRTHDFSMLPDNLLMPSNRFYYRLWEVPIFLLMGVGGGLMGGAFVKINVIITTLRHKYIPVAKPWRRLAEVVFMGTLTACIWFTVTVNSPCKPLPANVKYSEEHGELFMTFPTSGESVPVSSIFPRVLCPEDEYNAYGQLFFTDTANALRRMIGLNDPTHNMGEGDEKEFNPINIEVEVVALFFVLLWIMLTWTYGIGCASGLFVPSLCVGGAYGLLVAHAVRHFGGEYGKTVSFPTYAVMGSAASLGGATRMTVSITVLIAETMGAQALILPMMLCIFMSKFIGDMCNLGIYDTHIVIRGAPLLEEQHIDPHQAMLCDKLRTRDMMTSKVVALAPHMALSDLIRTLRTCSHASFPITADIEEARTGEGFNILGTIKRGHVLRLLKNRVGFINNIDDFSASIERMASGDALSSPSIGRGTSYSRNISGPDYASHTGAVSEGKALPTWVTGHEKSNKELLQLLEDFPVKIYDQETVLGKFDEGEMDTLVNLVPFMDREPPMVMKTQTLHRTYGLFRGMGYNHVYVCENKPKVVGVITRKDLLEDAVKLKLCEKVALGKAKINLEEAEYAMLTTLPFLPIPRGHSPSQGQGDVYASEDEEPVELRDLNDA